MYGISTVVMNNSTVFLLQQEDRIIIKLKIIIIYFAQLLENVNNIQKRIYCMYIARQVNYSYIMCGVIKRKEKI